MGFYSVCMWSEYIPIASFVWSTLLVFFLLVNRFGFSLSVFFLSPFSVLSLHDLPALHLARRSLAYPQRTPTVMSVPSSVCPLPLILNPLPHTHKLQHSSVPSLPGPCHTPTRSSPGFKLASTHTLTNSPTQLFFTDLHCLLHKTFILWMMFISVDTLCQSGFIYIMNSLTPTVFYTFCTSNLDIWTN